MSLRSESALGLHFVEAPAADPTLAEVADDPPPVPAPVQAVAPLFVPAEPASALGGTVLPTAQRRLALQTLDDTEVKGCPKCRLCQTRTRTVFGEGDADAAIFFVGEGPGENEDLTGRPFVGRGGQLLDKMIAGMGLTREQVYIGNCVKCRPPGNRVPAPDEAATCMPYLVRQLEIVRPQVIVTLGLTAAKYMLGDNKLAMGKIRGQWQQWRGRAADADVPPGVRAADADAGREAGRVGRPQSGLGRGGAVRAGGAEVAPGHVPSGLSTLCWAARATSQVRGRTPTYCSRAPARRRGRCRPLPVVFPARAPHPVGRVG